MTDNRKTYRCHICGREIRRVPHTIEVQVRCSEWVTTSTGCRGVMKETPDE